MKTFIATVVLSVSAFVSAQTPSPAASAPPPITISIVAPVATPEQLGCGTVTSPTIVLCAYRLFRLTGTCPATLPAWPTAPTGNPPAWTVPAGWTQVDVTGTSQLSATDTTTTYSTNYAYVVTAITPATATLQSQPSNCVNITTVAPPIPTALGSPTISQQN